MVTALEEMTKTQTENKDEDLEQLEELLGKFDDIPDDGYVKEDADKISSDLDQVEKSLSKVKFNPEKVSKNIQSTTGKKSEPEKKSE
jgi:archaellum component FlaC